jgi:hypothetical protein
MQVVVVVANMVAVPRAQAALAAVVMGHLLLPVLLVQQTQVVGVEAAVKILADSMAARVLLSYKFPTVILEH